MDANYGNAYVLATLELIKRYVEGSESSDDLFDRIRTIHHKIFSIFYIFLDQYPHLKKQLSRELTLMSKGVNQVFGIHARDYARAIVNKETMLTFGVMYPYLFRLKLIDAFCELPEFQMFCLTLTPGQDACLPTNIEDMANVNLAFCVCKLNSKTDGTDKDKLKRLFHSLVIPHGIMEPSLGAGVEPIARAKSIETVLSVFFSEYTQGYLTSTHQPLTRPESTGVLSNVVQFFCRNPAPPLHFQYGSIMSPYFPIYPDLIYRLLTTTDAEFVRIYDESFESSGVFGIPLFIISKYHELTRPVSRRPRSRSSSPSDRTPSPRNSRRGGTQLKSIKTKYKKSKSNKSNKSKSKK